MGLVPPLSAPLLGSSGQMGQVLADAGILLVVLGCAVAACLLLIHLLMALFDTDGGTAGDFGRLAVAWRVVSAVSLVAGLITEAAWPHAESVLLLLAYGVPAIGVGMSMLAAQSAARASRKSPKRR